MLRFSVGLIAMLALTLATIVSVPPAYAYSGEAFNKCMAKCQAQGNRRCDYWCDKKH